MTATQCTDPLTIRNPDAGEVMNLEQLRRAGVSDRRTRRLCGAGGPWRRLHPGVVLLRNTAPTRQQQLHAALVRYGPGVVITGADALLAHGVKCPPAGEIQLLVPDHCRVGACQGGRAARTARVPEPG